MDGEDTPKNKLGYENEPDYSTLKGAQAQEDPRQHAQSIAATAEQSATTAQKAESGATAVKSGTEAAAAFESGNYAKAVEKGIETIKHANNVTGKNDKEQGASSNIRKGSASIIVVLLLALIPIAFLVVPLIMPFHLLANIVGKFDSNAGLKEAAEQSYIGMIDGNASLADATLESIGYDGISQAGCDELFETPNGSIEYYSGHNTRGCVPTQLALIGNPPDPSATAYFNSKLLEGAVLADTGTPSTSNPYAYSGAFKWTDRDGEVHWIGPVEFSDYFHNNTEFNKAISQGSLGWTGTFSGWFDDMVRELMQKLELTRNTFQGFYEDVTDQLASQENYFDVIDAVNSKNTMTHTSNEKLLLLYNGCNIHYKGTARKIEITDTFADYIQATLVDKEGACVFVEPPEAIADLCDPNYRLIYRGGVVVGREIVNYTCPEVAYYDTRTSTKVGDPIDDASGTIQAYLPEMAKSFRTITRNDGTGDICAQLYGLSYFSVIVAANRLNQASTFAAQALEAIDKTRAGLGSESGIHQLAKQLSETGTYTHLEDGQNIEGLGYSIATSTTNRPALNSQGVSWINTNSAIDGTDFSVQNLSVEGVIKGFILEAHTVAACNASTVAGHILFSLISLVVGSSHSNFDANDEYMSGVERNLINRAIREAAYALVFNPCTTDDEGNLARNEDVGNCIALGAHNYLSQNHRLSGGSPADMEKLQQFVEQRRRTIAREAELDREQRSPFDVYSPNTFLGSIVGRVAPYAASLTSSSIFTSIGNIVTSSINSLLPTASALQTDTLIGNIGECKLLDSLDPTENGNGAVGDIFCVPYTITDIALFDPEIGPMSAKEVEAHVESLGGFDGFTEQNNRIINPESNFAKYIKYCSNRISIFGVIDANILKDYLEEVEENTGWFQSFFRRLLSFLTLGFYEYLESENLETALRWATGRNCVATNNPDINNNFWNEQGRYYQAYMTYQRININRSGGNGNNAIDTIHAYNAKHPINTPDDRIAATAGMLTEDYAIVRDYIAYQTTDLSSHGPTIASIAKPATIKFKHSITPLTDFLIEKIIPITTPNLIDPRQQGITA